VLINNAGIIGTHAEPAQLTGADVLAVFDVNVAGLVRTTTAFLPLLRKSADPVIINVSSGMGSLELTHDPSRDESSAVAPVYTSSKAAVTMLTTQYAKRSPTSASTPLIPVHRNRSQRKLRTPNRHRRNRRNRHACHRRTRSRIRSVGRPAP
jgi:hypothetical protein